MPTRLTAIAVSAVLVALAPGLGADAAKRGKRDKIARRAPSTVVVTTTTETTTTTAPTTTEPTTTVPPTTEAPIVAAKPITSDTWGISSLEQALDLYVEFATASYPTSMSDVVAQIGADEMWAAGYTGAGIDVAVIDTGVAPIAELSTTNVFVGPDLSFEGDIDAVAGLDTFGHGTHMAGIIAGRTPGADPLDPGDADFLGVAPDARIVSVKVADNTGAVDVSQVIAAIDWVVQNRNQGGLNIRVLNLSYNTNGTQSAVLDPLSKAVENAWNHGIFVAVSAGNEGNLSFGLASPATNSKVMAVSAARLDSTYGWVNPLWAPSGDGHRNPDLLAPGVSIMSLRTPGSRVDLEHPEGRVGDDRLFLGSGTSQSTAVVSGAAALILQQRPGLSPDQVKSLLINSATDTFQFELVKGSGVVNLTAAMHADVGKAAQSVEAATGLGSLEAARGTDHVTIGGELLVGEYTVNGAEWDPIAWVAASEAGTAWNGTDDWSGSTWSGSTWSGSTWSGSTWSGSTWSGSTWSGSTWSGSTWSGSTWSGSTWSGSTWS
jgi:serine protease AprX